MLDAYNLNTLVVDDQQHIRGILKLQLRQIGVNSVTEAPNAAIALDKMRANKFD